MRASPGPTLVQHDSGWLARVGVRMKDDMGRVPPYGRFNVYRASGGTDITNFNRPAGSTAIRTVGDRTSAQSPPEPRSR